jgi:hypothetical protein
MKMSTTRANDRITEQSDALEIIAKELTWLLNHANTTTSPVNSPLGRELALRFMQLYNDFLKVRKKISDLCEEMEGAEFDDRTLSMVYKHTAHLLLRKTYMGIFEKFTCVAEFRKLPPE